MNTIEGQLGVLSGLESIGRDFVRLASEPKTTGKRGHRGRHHVRRIRTKPVPAPSQERRKPCLVSGGTSGTDSSKRRKRLPTFEHIEGFVVHESDCSQANHDSRPPKANTQKKCAVEVRERVSELQTGEFVYTLNPDWNRFAPDNGSRLFLYEVRKTLSNGTLRCRFFQETSPFEFEPTDGRRFFIVDEDSCKLVKPTPIGDSSVLVDPAEIDFNYDFCCQDGCGKGGALIACDSCPRCFHRECLSDVTGIEAEAQWSCPVCRNSSEFGSFNPRGVLL